ncbi:hypothetical protein KCU61_g553, partial [Aureobasidium melanogenum]
LHCSSNMYSYSLKHKAHRSDLYNIPSVCHRRDTLTNIAYLQSAEQALLLSKVSIAPIYCLTARRSPSISSSRFSTNGGADLDGLPFILNTSISTPIIPAGSDNNTCEALASPTAFLIAACPLFRLMNLCAPLLSVSSSIATLSPRLADALLIESRADSASLIQYNRMEITQTSSGYLSGCRYNLRGMQRGASPQERYVNACAAVLATGSWRLTPADGAHLPILPYQSPRSPEQRLARCCLIKDIVSLPEKLNILQEITVAASHRLSASGRGRPSSAYEMSGLTRRAIYLRNQPLRRHMSWMTGSTAIDYPEAQVMGMIAWSSEAYPHWTMRP